MKRDQRDLPPRVIGRPDPTQWQPDEFMTLGEAAALFWPGGPIREASLRTARRDGQLAVARVAGKLLTTRAAIEEMTRTALLSDNDASRRKAVKRIPSVQSEKRAALRSKIRALVDPSSDGRSRA